jgi:3'(2'), 5'-bisphosphate nucleotidase
MNLTLPPVGVPLPALDAVEAIARAAGQVILQIYGTDFSVTHKSDASPLTLADEAAEALIVPALQALLPGVPVVAEEAAARGDLPAAAALFWLVDPLDGTREFVARNGEFTVNIALVAHGVPVLGVLLAPALGRLFSGVPGQGAWLDDAAGRRAIHCRRTPAEGATVAASRAYGDAEALGAFLQGRNVACRVAAGSALKFGLVASGEADLYPRFGRTMEWDTAAGHAVVLAAGGRVCDVAGQPLRYGKPGYANPDFIVYGAG